MWTVGRCIVYTGIRLLLLIHSFIVSFFFLSNFQALNVFVTHFSRTVRSRRKLVTHVVNGWMYHVYRNQAAAAYSSLYFSFFFISKFQTLTFFVTLFSGTVRPRSLKLVTHEENGWMYRVYWNHAATLICPFIFLSVQFSSIKHFSSHFFQELWGLEDWNLVQSWTVCRCIVLIGIRLLLLIDSFISSFFFLSNFQALKIFVGVFWETVRSRRLKLHTNLNGR